MEGRYDLLFPDNEEEFIRCSHCGKVIFGDQKVKWVNKKNKIFKCPKCEKEISIK